MPLSRTLKSAGFGVGAHRALGDRAVHQLAQRVVGVGARLQQLGQLDRLRHRGDHPAVLAVGVGDPLHERQERAPGVVAARGLARLALEPAHALGGDRGDEVVLGREAAVDRALADAGARGDLRDRRALALLAEHLRGGRDDALAVADGVGAGARGDGGHACTGTARHAAAAGGDQERGDRGGERDARADQEGVGVAAVGREAAGDDAAGQHGGADLRAERGADRAHERVHAGRLAGLLRRDRLDDQVRHRGEREPDAGRHHEVPDDDLELGAVEERHQQQAGGRDDRAERERHARAEARPEHARERAGDEHHQRAGDHQQARAGGVEPEAVAARRGRLGELRDEDERAEHAEADEHGREVGHRDDRLPQHLDVDQRLGASGAAARPRS